MSCASSAVLSAIPCDEMGYLCRVPYWKKSVSCANRCFPENFSEKEIAPDRTVPVLKENPSLKNDSELERDFALEKDTASETTDPISEDGYLCGATGCGLCTLKQLSDAGITHLKLVGRGNYTDFMERDIRNLRRTLEILADSSTEEEYIRAMKAELFPNGCNHMCYAR